MRDGSGCFDPKIPKIASLNDFIRTCDRLANTLLWTNFFNICMCANFLMYVHFRHENLVYDKTTLYVQINIKLFLKWFTWENVIRKQARYVEIKISKDKVYFWVVIFELCTYNSNSKHFCQGSLFIEIIIYYHFS